MSKDVFTVDPIFFLPIDIEEDLNISESNEKSNNVENKTFSDKNILNCEEKNNKNENAEVITFSLNKNDRNIKSMTNSSKIYISEIFKRNWKLKSRRLIAKLKKRLIKQWNHYCLIKFENNKNVVNNNFIQEKIIKSNNINKKFDFNNFINNNVTNISHMNAIINNSLYHNNFNNINKFGNINIFINQCNNNNNKIYNSFISHNKTTKNLTLNYNNKEH
jgi:hypothetical protein